MAVSCIASLLVGLAFWLPRSFQAVPKLKLTYDGCVTNFQGREEYFFTLHNEAWDCKARAVYSFKPHPAMGGWLMSTRTQVQTSGSEFVAKGEIRKFRLEGPRSDTWRMVVFCTPAQQSRVRKKLADTNKWLRQRFGIPIFVAVPSDARLVSQEFAPSSPSNSETSGYDLDPSLHLNL
ncbi:MAG TPA: hypothetical protein VEH27_18950 [Methylomirabilota bacterium]|nr:hypothetical protein [Methylomirabilota bacterium]